MIMQLTQNICESQPASHPRGVAGRHEISVREIGGCYNEIDEFDSPEDFLAEMASARLVTAKSPFRVHFHSTLAKLQTRLARGKRLRDKILRS